GSSTRTRRGRKMRRFSSCSFRGSFSIITTSRRSRIRTIPARHGRTSHCKAFTSVWWCMEWKDSITSAHAKNSGYPMSFKSKRWPQSADPDRKKCSLKNYRPAKVRMIGGNSWRASLKVLFTQANKACKILSHPVTIVAMTMLDPAKRMRSRTKDRLSLDRNYSHRHGPAQYFHGV